MCVGSEISLSEKHCIEDVLKMSVLCLLFRWLSYVLLLLLDLVVCFFILLGLAKQARWLLIL